ncbi:MAG: hypothetical protein JM58_12365 [Peptococcaceae bacterium BICA1-8]|nr:MAG: hypothetical protein JM58_12365 [Peptococcaceae bacterium BICA1-8]
MSLLCKESKEQLLPNTCEYRINGDFELDGIKPQLILKPSCDKETADVLALASANNKSLAVRGGGTKISYGSPFENIDWILSTQSLAGDPIIHTDDLIAVVKAGTTLAELQNQLHKKGLFLPFDCELNKATVGGVLAFGSGSSHRLSYGMIRDSILGLKVALTDGKIYRFGGQTVKNVAGYDVSKLFIGSKGTLGVITEAYLRIYALPPSSRVILFSVKSADELPEIINEISNMEPTVFEIFDYSLAKQLFGLNDSDEQSFNLLVKYSGPNPTVDKKTAQTLGLIEEHGYNLLKVFEKEDESNLWKKRIRFFERDSVLINKDDIIGEDVGLKMSLPPVNLYGLLKSLLGISEKQGIKMHNLYIPTLGIIHSRLEFCNLEVLNDITKIVNSMNGFIIIENGTVTTRRLYCSLTWKNMDLKLKRFFDPTMVLNPGKQP